MPEHSLYKRLKHRADELMKNRTSTEPLWQEIADNALGRRDFTFSTVEPGRKRTQPIFDSTFRVSSQLLKGAMHSLLVPLGARWFEFEFEDPAANNISQAAPWLDLAEKRVYAAIRAPEANFHAQLSETISDLIDFGTGGIFIDDVPGKGVEFSSRPLQEIYLAEAPNGRIDTIVRVFKLTNRQAVEEWGDEVKRANEALKGLDAESKSTYIHIILPNDEHVKGNVDRSGMKWASFHLSPDDNAIVGEKGYHELPLPTPRWEKEPGEVYGRGPGTNAISDHNTLNEMVKLSLSASQMAVFPTTIVDSEVVLPGDFAFIPKSVLVVNAMMANMDPPIQQLRFEGNLAITEAMIVTFRDSVQEAFLNQLVKQLTDPRMTASQFLGLTAQIQRHQAPILGRLQTELLEPVLERVFAIEDRAGRLPKPPPELIELQKRTKENLFKINYVAPVAKAQQTSDAQAVMSFTNWLTEANQILPAVLDIANFDEMARDVASALGVAAKNIRDTKSVKVIREAQEQRAEEQEQEREAVVATDQIAKLMKAAPTEAAA